MYDEIENYKYFNTEYLMIGCEVLEKNLRSWIMKEHMTPNNNPNPIPKPLLQTTNYIVAELSTTNLVM